MKTEYCPHCGTKHTYEAAAPKFCSNCGQPLNDSRASLSSDPNPTEADPNPTEAETIERTPFLDKLEYTIDISASSPKLGDLIKAGAPDDKFVRVKGKGKGKGVEAHLKESIAECQSIRQSEEIGE